MNSLLMHSIMRHFGLKGSAHRCLETGIKHSNIQFPSLSTVFYVSFVHCVQEILVKDGQGFWCHFFSSLSYYHHHHPTFNFHFISSEKRKKSRSCIVLHILLWLELFRVQKSWLNSPPCCCIHRHSFSYIVSALPIDMITKASNLFLCDIVLLRSRWVVYNIEQDVN